MRTSRAHPAPADRTTPVRTNARVRHDVPDRGKPKEVTTMRSLIAEDRSADLTGHVWVDAATPCRVDDAELWFAETPERIARAQQLCGGCPLRADCLAGALERREPWGVWGGELFEHGVPVARKRRPGRPRKDDDRERQLAEQALADRLGHELDRDLELLTADGDDGVAA